MPTPALIRTRLGLRRTSLKRKRDMLAQKLKAAKHDASRALDHGDERTFDRASRRYAQLNAQHARVGELLDLTDAMIDAIETQTAVSELVDISEELRSLHALSTRKSDGAKWRFWDRARAESAATPADELLGGLDELQRALTEEERTLTKYSGTLASAADTADDTMNETIGKLRRELQAETDADQPLPETTLEPGDEASAATPTTPHPDRAHSEPGTKSQTEHATPLEPNPEPGPQDVSVRFDTNERENAADGAQTHAASTTPPQFPRCTVCGEPIYAFFADFHHQCADEVEKRCRVCDAPLEGEGYMYYTLNTYTFYYCMSCVDTLPCAVCSLPVGKPPEGASSTIDDSTEFGLCPTCRERFVVTADDAATVIEGTVLPLLRKMGLEPLEPVPMRLTPPGMVALGGMASIDTTGMQQVEVVMTTRPYFDTVCAHEYAHIYCYQNMLEASKRCETMPCPFHEGFAELFAYRFAKRHGIAREGFEKMESPEYRGFFRRFLSLYDRYGFDGVREALLNHSYII